jgi:hypothetical protein
MRTKVVPVLLLLSLLVLVKTPRAQDITLASALNQVDRCSLPGAEAFPGTIYRHRDETVYYRCGSVLGPDAQPAGVAWISGEVRNGTFFLAEPKVGGQCSRPGNLRYTVGAVVNFAASKYRCSDVFGKNMTTSGVAWVEVEASDSNRFAIKGLR